MLLVLWGVVTVVFMLFNLTGNDPVRNLVGENANQEVMDNMRIKLGLNHSVSVRYVEYLNHLSPISYYQESNRSEAFYIEPQKIHGVQLGLGAFVKRTIGALVAIGLLVVGG